MTTGGGRWASRGAPRLLRGAGLAVCCASLGIAGHALAGGGPPAPAPVLLGALVIAGAGVALADRQRGLPAILVTVAGTQLAMHVLLDAFGHGPHGSPASGGGATLMVGAHATAALVTAVLLAGAERAVYAVGAVLDWLLRTLPARPLVVPGPRSFTSLPAGGSLPGLVGQLVVRLHGRRGPPVPL